MVSSKTDQHQLADQFSREVTGLPVATPTQTVSLADSDTYNLVAAPVRKWIGDAEVRLLAYNGSVPGPTLRVPQGSTVTFNFTNQTDLESTVHWHGLRLDNRFDGTPETQAPVPAGGSFRYRVHFPDPGVHWYHPHIREDYGQEMGLAGNIVVVPVEASYWPPVHREIALILDDILIEDGQVAPFSRTETTHVAMGRFGNVFLANGEPDFALTAKRGEVVRFYLTNTANTRIFNLAFSGARIKLVGGDSGHCEQEAFVDSVLLAPSERVIVDVCFDQAGAAMLEHRSPERSVVLATVTVSEDAAQPPLSDEFATLRRNADLATERQRLAPFFDAAPDKTLAFVAEMHLDTPENADAVYTCPMHLAVVSPEPGRCPECGMTLLAAAPTYTCPMHPEVVSDTPGSCLHCGMKLLPAHLAGQDGDHHHEAMGHAAMHEHNGHHDHASHNGHEAHHAHHGHHDEDHAHHGDHHAMPEHEQQHQSAAHVHAGHSHGGTGRIEWEDDMEAVNRMTTPANMRWKLVDRATGAENHAIAWRFRVGDRVKIRLINEMDSDHPMPHPFHVHGAGRFLVLARNGVVEPNLMWKDTVLILTGETVDILLEVTNPGVWMAHCHIAEHHEAGMMFSFVVDE